MIRRAFDDIEEADLSNLVSNRVSEGRSLEFKRELPGNSNDDKKEFLADATSLANAQGGDLIFGIEEKGGSAERLVGLDVADPDAAILRLENILRDGVEPRLIGVRVRWVPIQSGSGAIILRAPASLAAPHRIRFMNDGRFCNRNSRGKYEMDTHELRLAFTSSEELPAKLRQLHRVAADKTLPGSGERFPVRMPFDPTVTFSVIPLSILRDRRDLPVAQENAVLPPLMRPNRGINFVHMLEGVLSYTPPDEPNQVRSYALTHRSGRVDAAWTLCRDDEEQKAAWPDDFRDGILDVAGAAMGKLFIPYGIEGPWVLFATLTKIEGIRMAFTNGRFSRPAWEAEVTLPEVVIVDQLSEGTLRPLLDSFPLVFGVRSDQYQYPSRFA